MNSSISGSLDLINIKFDTFNINSDDHKLVIIVFIRLDLRSHSVIKHGNVVTMGWYLKLVSGPMVSIHYFRFKILILEQLAFRLLLHYFYHKKNVIHFISRHYIFFLFDTNIIVPIFKPKDLMYVYYNNNALFID